MVPVPIPCPENEVVAHERDRHYEHEYDDLYG
jgi:hypothetical protein